jgi:hypothetical protein
MEKWHGPHRGEKSAVLSHPESGPIKDRVLLTIMRGNP